MKIPQYARYDYCVKRALEFLEEFKIKSYPIDVEKIIIQQKWALTPYSLLMQEFNCDREKVIQCLRSQDGYTQFDNENYSIAYNDDPKLGNRKRFTLMHEIGHIYLNHLNDFDMTLLYRGSLSKEENKVLENEANAFARNVLIPISKYLHLKNKSVKNVSIQFGVTTSAAQTRIDLIYRDINSFNHLSSSKKNMLVCSSFVNKMKCYTCGTQLYKQYIYCPICGSINSLKWGNIKMEYIEYQINNEGFLERCIRCKNKKILGNFCHICGAPVKNFCSSFYYAEGNYNACNHSEPLSGNARFCPYCGAESTFYQHKILVDWNIEYNNNQKKENAESKTLINAIQNFDGFMDIPEGLDDELPFN